jgi:aquaporin Z
VAEAAGTALFVLGALSAVALVLGAGSPVGGLGGSARELLAGALVATVVSAIAVSPLGRLSGAHLNPAVTLAFRALGCVSRHDVAGYLVAQLAGALAGGLLFRALWGSVAASVGGGVTHPTVPVAVALALEASMTAALVATIAVFVSRERLARWTPAAIWPVLTVLIWKAGPLTGTSLNPARSAGPALAFNDLADLWLYVVAPMAGALATAVALRRPQALARPLTAKLFHDERYACSLASALPAADPSPARISSATSPRSAPTTSG